jgi:DNA-directed RNA polymerase subunit RPC12/RpoP
MSSEISYTCPHCSGEMTFKPEHYGMDSQCPYCLNAVVLGGKAFQHSQQSQIITNTTTPPVNSKIKERAKWWIVTTHVLTAGFAMPVIAAFFAAILIGLLGIGIDGILAGLIIVIFNFAGYIGGTFYSLSYLKKNAKTSDWNGCTIPSIIFAVLLNFGTLIFFHPYPIINSIVSIINLIVFSIITVNGFRKLDGEN